jgi:two-component system chemotaxis sensor kinase CheA
MSIRMIPMSTVFSRFPRMLRDLASKLGKKIDLVTLGEATELDKGLVEKITDPLTHLVRNSVDHGIEMPEDRIAAGKSEHGTLTLAASHQGGSIVIEVRDDGKGMNRERILNKARERGMDVSDSMPDSDVWQLIARPASRRPMWSPMSRAAAWAWTWSSETSPRWAARWRSSPLPAWA